MYRSLCVSRVLFAHGPSTKSQWKYHNILIFLFETGLLFGNAKASFDLSPFSLAHRFFGSFLGIFVSS